MLKAGLLLVLLACASLQPLSAYAADKPAPAEKAEAEQPKPAPRSNIMPVKIKPVQEGADGVSKAGPEMEQSSEVDPDSLTLYSTQRTGSLGAELWNGVPRQEVINGFNNLPVPKFSPVQRDLALRLLLTKAEIAPAEGEKRTPDVFTARIKKLIELGAFKEVMTLNEKLDSPIENEAAALAGMQAFIANGQTAIACLEQKALGNTFEKEDPFWDHLDKFCQIYIKTDGENVDVSQSLMQAAIAYSKQENVGVPGKFEDLNNASFIELLVMSKSGLLDRGKWSSGTAQKLKPSVIAFLLAMEPSYPPQKFSLLTVAVAHGIKTPDDLKQAYKTTYAADDWGAITTNATKLGKAKDRPVALKAMLAPSGSLTPAAYIPFADQFASATPAEPFTSEDARFILKILIAAQKDLPLAWVNYAYGTDYAGKESGESALLKIWQDIPAQVEKEDKKPSAPVKAKDGKISPELAYARVLQGFVKDGTYAQEKPAYTYDNFLSLTGSTNYVMPSDELTESLKKAAVSKHLGRTIMYGLQAMGGYKANHIHPAVLFQILKVLKTAGLSEETSSLAHEALAGLTREKKEN